MAEVNLSYPAPPPELMEKIQDFETQLDDVLTKRGPNFHKNLVMLHSQVAKLKQEYDATNQHPDARKELMRIMNRMLAEGFGITP
jgi:hypothetical protein